jgi:hypothetical protein
MPRGRKPKNEYTVSLKVNGQEYENSGKTLFEAADMFDKRFPYEFKEVIKTKALLTIKHGTKKFEQLLTPWQVRRFFVSQVARELIIKRYQHI